MKLKKYKELFEGKDKKIKNQIQYIEDVFVRLQDCIGCNINVTSFGYDDDEADEEDVPYTLSGIEPFFKIDIELKNQETSETQIAGGFTSLDDYFQFNEIMKRIVDQLLHDYSIDCLDIDKQDYGENYYVILSTREK